MTTHELYAIANAIAPKSLSDEYCAKYGAYDNSGILLDTGEDIQKVVFSLDLTKGALEKAIEVGANAIVTHHPAIYGGIEEICKDKNPLGEKLIACIRGGISVISMHLNLDGVEGGIDESLQNAVLSATDTETAGDLCIMHPLTQGGYGRAYTVEKTPLQTLESRLSRTLKSSRILVYGDGEKPVRRVASFCGAGVDDETLAFAKAQGADVMISADYKHHFIVQALELGMRVIVLTHYSAEQYGFEKYYENIRRQVTATCIYHVDGQLL